MGMISAETAWKIASAHREISASNKLLEEIDNCEKQGEKFDPRDAFGRRSGFQLGVPSGERCHQLFDLSQELVPYVVRAHIAAKTKELAEACERARMELDGVLEAAVEPVEPVEESAAGQ